MPKRNSRKTVKGLDKEEYLAVCKELKDIIPGRKVKSCNQRWKKGLDP